MSNLKDAPAFPTTKEHISPGGRQFTTVQDGMTFRQYAAVAALQGLLSSGEAMRMMPRPPFGKVTQEAIDYADALIKQLEVGDG